MGSRTGARVAAAHVAPIYHDTKRTIDKACSVIEEAARGGAHLVAFPEAFVPGFPVWANVAAPTHTHGFFDELAGQAIRIDGPEIGRLRTAARDNGIVVSMGFNEGTAASGACLWNANVLIGSDGALLTHHRKLVPTFFERMVWAEGDGAGLRVADTSAGRVGMLICGENTNPLARYTMIAQGEQIHISTYPPVGTTRPASAGRGYDLEQAIRIRAAAHAFEGKVFNVVAATCYDVTLRKALEPLGADVIEQLDGAPKPVSMIVDPHGRPVGTSMRDEEGLCVADVDFSEIVELKRLHDVSGHYNRFDIFRLHVNREPLEPIHLSDAPSPRQSTAGRPVPETLAETPSQDPGGARRVSATPSSVLARGPNGNGRGE